MSGNPHRLLSATLMLALFLAAIGSTSPGPKGQPEFPPPRRFAAIFLLWFLFGLAVNLGREATRFVSALAGLVVLAMGMGVAGKRALGWLTREGSLLSLNPQARSEVPTS